MQFSTKVILAASMLFGQSLAQSAEQQHALDLHNNARTEVGVPELVWDDDLANDAQDWANHLASNNAFEHSGVDGQGENIWEGWGMAAPLSSAAIDWINEKSSYSGQAIDSSNYQTFGHYTQIVWRETTKVGFAAATGSQGGTVVVARYNGPGNYMGQTAY